MMDIDLIREPDWAWIETEEGSSALEKGTAGWRNSDAGLEFGIAGGVLGISISAPRTAVKRIVMRWKHGLRAGGGLQVYGDHWERGYGDLEWRQMVPERVMPWYAIIHDGAHSFGFGVKTGGRSFSHWRLDRNGVTLVSDISCGAEGVLLGSRILPAAEVVQYAGEEGESAHSAANRLCRSLCDTPVMPEQPIYGGNNWYYTYGVSSHEEVVADARFISELAEGLSNRPYMIIDDGWQINGNIPEYNGGPWVGNRKFPDMRGLAEEMSEAGVRPGIWFRPLLTSERVPESWILKGSADRCLDPSHPDVLRYVAEDMKTLVQWGFKLIKHDFSTFDLLGEWGFKMGSRPIGSRHSFSDRSRTTAEIIVDFYRAIADAASDALVIGCNTIGHLAAGLFAIQRTGDDTSGKGWERTRRMGINTLAFRMHQHGAFFSHDADCVALTSFTPWQESKQWLELVANSGTPLFLSAKPGSLDAEQTEAVRNAFRIASMPQPAAEPLDWLRTTCASRWKFGKREAEFDWYGEEGIREEERDSIWWK
ncbi:glycoside hydrolase family 36 protein [Cohnella lupini]|uniref:Alpha-galactosidase n=1 Tax=Cohnella lupini TaxID=1294267 RepID=A0A3D9ISY1_9BACL|nr:glycoside hydrolase family 36 protein [Cohnella lupini]RED64872.1 alpha-galactosidase [Cohnella lupini]